MKTIKIRQLKYKETYWAAYAGEYRNHSGKTFYLSNPQADTIHALKDLSPADQVEMLYFALIKANWGFISFKKLQQLRKEFSRLRNKFGFVWNGNARHTLPVLDELPWTSCIKEEHLDRDFAKSLFEVMLKYEFVLYNPLHASCENCREPQ